MNLLYSISQIRCSAVLTMVDDEVYDIANMEFIDLKRKKIIHYDNLTNYYDETNARIKLVVPGEAPKLQLKQETVLLEVDDESLFYAYEKDHVNQEESKDLTSDFLAEVKGKPYTLSRKFNNNKRK